MKTPTASYQKGHNIIWSGPISSKIYVCKECIEEHPGSGITPSLCYVVGKECALCHTITDCEQVPPCDDCGIPLTNTHTVFPHHSDESKAYCAECAPTSPIKMHPES